MLQTLAKPHKTTWVESAAFPRTEPWPHTVNHFGISGGKDSTALLLWALFESGLPRESLDVSFCDTGNESPETYDYLRYLEQRLQFGITWVTPERDFWQLAHLKKRFPSAKARFCTYELKIKPATDYLDAHFHAGREILMHSGVRASESKERAQLPEWDIDAKSGFKIRRPMLGWSISDVWLMHDKYDVKPNPLYAKGMTRVGCFPCIMSRKKEIRQIAKQFPAAIVKLKTEEVNFPGERGSTFFAADKVTKRHRTGTYTRESDGKVFKIATIDDVVRWSKTERGGAQYEIDFNYDKLPGDEDRHVCPSTFGLCE